MIWNVANVQHTFAKQITTHTMNIDQKIELFEQIKSLELQINNAQRSGDLNEVKFLQFQIERITLALESLIR